MIRVLTVREYSSTHVISNLTSCGDLADFLISMCRDCKANEELYVRLFLKLESFIVPYSPICTMAVDEGTVIYRCRDERHL